MLTNTLPGAIIKPSKRDRVKRKISKGYLSKRTIIQMFD